MALKNDVVDSTKGGLYSQRLLKNIDAVFFLLDLLDDVIQMTPCRFQSFKSILFNSFLHIHTISYPNGEGMSRERTRGIFLTCASRIFEPHLLYRTSAHL